MIVGISTYFTHYFMLFNNDQLINTRVFYMNTRKIKNIVITGGNHGLGKAIALYLAEKGQNILFTYNSDEKAAQETIKEIEKFKVKVKSVKVDLCKDEDLERLVKESYEFFDDVDVLINNAGLLSRASILDVPQVEIEKILRVNTVAPFLLLQKFGTQMKKNQCQRIDDACKNMGLEETKKLIASSDKLKILADYCIICITSISRKVPTGLTSYEISKAATHQLVKSAASELADYFIRVNDVAPGLIPTNLNKTIWQDAPTLWQKLSNNIPLGFTGDPMHVAQAVESIIQNEWMTGSTVTVDGGRSVNFLGAETHSTMVLK